MAGVDFVLVLQVVAYILGIWGTGRLFKLCKQPAILGYLLCGIIMGPQFLDIVPYASDGTCETMTNSRRLDEIFLGRQLDELEVGGPWLDSLLDSVGRRLASTPEDMGNGSSSGSGSASCDNVPWGRYVSGHRIVSIWTMIGNVGVTLMIFQSGMHIHFDKVYQVGRKAFIVAIFGTFLPLGVGMAFVGFLFPDAGFFPSGFAAGCAFAPTSIDISIKLLDESKMLNTLAGQTTLTAAFIDDIFALGTLVLMQNLADGNVGPQSIITLIVASFGFLALGVVLALCVPSCTR